MVEMLSVPVVANGSIYTGNDACHMIQETGAAAVMPGRGLLGNPWLIPEIIGQLTNKKYNTPQLKEKKEVCLDHLRLLVDFYGERRAILKMRSILPHYFSSCLYLKALKKDVQLITTAREVHLLLDHVQDTGMSIEYRR